jgi:hypothetical protein
MAQEPRPLQAQFDPDEIEVEVQEGIGFEPGVMYRFTLEKPPSGKYMQYGTKREDGLAGLYVLSKKCPKDLLDQYQKHPDQYEIFTNREINGQQALIPGKDFDQFKPFLSRLLDIAWVYESEEGGKRLIFMSFNPDYVTANDKHPGDRSFESPGVCLARKLGMGIKAHDKFTWSFLHPGVAIEAEVEMVQKKGDTRERPQIIFDTIVKASDGGPSGSSGSAQKKIADDIDPEIKMTVMELADGKKTVVEVIKAVKAHLKDENLEKAEMSALLGKYSDAINKLKNSGEILG